MKPTILFVDDEPKILSTLKRMFARNADVMIANEGPMALEILQRNKIDVVVCDQRMPGMSGIDVLRAAREISPNTIRIVLTGYADLEAAIDAVNQGEVYRYINKPWSNEELLVTVLEATKKAASLPDQEPEDTRLEEGLRLKDCGVLILDKDRDLVNSILFGMGDDASIYTCDTPDNAFQVLKAQDIGVLIADSDIGGQEVTSTIFNIKAEYPDLVVIIVTYRADIIHIVELINKGQIFRFIPKPTTFNVLEPNIKAAVAAYFRTDSGKRLKQKLAEEDDNEPWY